MALFGGATRQMVSRAARDFKTRWAGRVGMAEMSLTVTHTGKGHAMECRTPQGALIGFDSADDAGHGASPVQHLLSAIGACALVDVDLILRKKRIEFSNLRVDCIGQRREEAPKYFTDVRLVFRVDGNIPQKVMDDVVKLSVDKYCSVAGTVVNATPVRYESIIG